MENTTKNYNERFQEDIYKVMHELEYLKTFSESGCAATISDCLKLKDMECKLQELSFDIAVMRER